MGNILDADWFRAGALGAATLVMAMAWRHEYFRLGGNGSSGRRPLWPMCWLLIGAIYAFMALALSVGLVGTLGGIGRDLARAEEWYESRRPFQAAVVAIVGLIWLAIIVIGIWRVPGRRRRYLPSALLCTSLVSFAIIRIVSLHQIDTILVRTSVAGAPVGKVIELVGVIAAVILAASAARRPVSYSGSRRNDLDHQLV